MNQIQANMFSEMQEKKIFEEALQYAFQYIEEVYDRNIYPSEEALADLSHFDENLPKDSSDASEVLKKLNTYGAPATMAQIGGRYHGFVNGSSVPVGQAAKMLGTFWDQNTAMHVISPIVSKLETVVESWLKELFGLPEETVAGFVSGTSMANLCGLAAARYRILQKQGWDINEQGLHSAPPVRIVTGKHAHSTVLKAISILGLGKQNIEWVEVDDQGRLLVENLPELDAHSILILQAGNVNSGSFDPLEVACKKAQAADAWVHIDGAFGLWAGAVEKLAHLTQGMNLGTSWAVDGHKTLNTPYDSGIVLCADKEALVAALHMTAGYIILSKERDGMFFTPEMSRRSRIIELWAVMRYLGKAGIDEMVYGMYKAAQQFARELNQIEGLEVLNEVVFNQVMIACESDEQTDALIARVQELRECWVGGSSWNGKRIIRISVCSWATTEADISRSVKSFATALQQAKRPNWV
ncbi:MAG: aminotransferase class V-fold PLP-dependent enzyme [Bacteroidota bacterium]